MKYFDTHAHYDFGQFRGDRSRLLGGLPEVGIVGVVNIGIDVETSQRSIELAHEYPYIWATVGFHPHNADQVTEAGIESIKRLASDERVVAIGETGFDYFRNRATRDNQRKWFARQLELSLELQLPVVVHSREAAEDTLRMLRHYDIKRAVVHCFNDTVDYALQYEEMGLMIGLGGTVTYPRTQALAEAIKALRPETILLETDCPYLSPHPNRSARNDSTNIPAICRRIAEIRGEAPEEIAAKTTANAQRFYGTTKHEAFVVS